MNPRKVVALAISMVFLILPLDANITLASSASDSHVSLIGSNPEPVQPIQADVSWSMAGANPQRTSWVPEGVDPAASSQFGVEWFRPIEAYIGQHVQLVTARDKIYVSTARGLYALDTASGDEVWRFDTEMPLGHSPTVVDDVVYVGGFDRRVYALNADTGLPIWTFAGAKGGFSTNPLVVEGKVLLGSRDGYFYALDQNNGHLVWQYPANSQEPLAPILYSAAYKGGRVFFAANDNYAYALSVNDGTLLWRSERMPGDGYQAWWPVVYGNYVIFSGAVAYAETADPGTQSVADVIDPGDPYYAQMHGFQYGIDFIKTIQRDDVFHQNEADGSLLGPEFVAGGSGDTTGIAWSWQNGKTVVDASKVTEYLEDDGQSKVNRPTNKPWRRGVIVLNAATGGEYTFDSDHDSHPEYAPFLFAGTKSGNRYPPLIIPTTSANGSLNDVIYAQDMYQKYGGWGIPRASLVAWQFGTQYIHPIGEQFAIDEPFADSAGGSMLYQNLCCDRIGQVRNLETGTHDLLWGYAGYTLESIKLEWQQIEAWMTSVAPGYDVMWSEASMYDYYPRLYGNYGTKNGIYHNHGLQNPIIPYKGRLFVHRSNAIIAFGPHPVSIRKMAQNETPEAYEQNIRQEYPQFSRPLLEINPPDQTLASTLSLNDVQASLDGQIAKMLQAGHLRPGYYNGTRGFSQLADYFENPGDTLYILVQAYPFVSDSLKPDLEKYIKQHYKMYFEDGLASRTGYWINNPKAYDLNHVDAFGQLQPREWMPLAPEITQDIKGHQASLWPGVGWPWDYPQHNFYAMWLYAKTFYSDDPVQLEAIYNSAKERLDTTPPDAETLRNYVWVHNAFIAGYNGFLNLQEMAGKAQQDATLRLTVETELNSLWSLRVNEFSKDHPWGTGKDPGNINVDKRTLSVARNFMYLTPELADYLHTHTPGKIEEAVDEYEQVAPYWIATRYEASFGEFASDNLYTHHAIFQAQAYAVQESVSQLLKYVDVPAFDTGDLFYIQNLVAILDNAGIILKVNPAFQSIDTGGSAVFSIEVNLNDDSTEEVIMSAPSPSPGLNVDLSPLSLTPPGQAILTLTDLHPSGSLSSGLWYTVSIKATVGDLEKAVRVNLLVNGQETYLPMIQRTS